jgi:hypothetical protein
MIPDWLEVDGSFECGSGLNLDVGELGDVISRLNVGFAGSVLSGVAVSSLRGDTVVDDVLESVVHETTIATFVFVFSASAVNELLFGEVREGTVSKEDGSFN